MRFDKGQNRKKRLVVVEEEQGKREIERDESNN